MKPETIIQNGQTYVLVQPEVYQSLVEDAEMLQDIQAYDAAKARQEEAFPLDVMDSIDTGEHPVRAFRLHRDMSQKELAEKAGLERVTITQIETRARKGTVEQYKAIAKVLNVNVDSILSE